MALFVPDPDGLPVEEMIEQLALEIAARYAGAEDELIREVASRARRHMELISQLHTAPAGAGLTVAERIRQNRILAELSAHRARSIRELQFAAAAIVEKLRADDLARRVVEIAAREGEAAAAARLGLAGIVPTGVASTPFIGGAAAVSTTTLTGSATQAVAAVVLSLDSRLEALNQRLTRYPQDAYQRIVSIYSPTTLLGVTTSRVMQAQAVQRFLSEGISDFIDRGNRRWTIGAYAEMAGRTTVNRAFNDAGVWRMQQSGIDLVTVVRGLDSCEKCAAWAGKILSTNGVVGPVTLPHATGGEDVTVVVDATVDQARNAGWNHPNCRCRLVAYLPGLTVPQSDTTYDPEAEKERAQQRAIERDIRKAKRAEAVAPDEVTAARARRDIREAQADMRAFIRDTGRNRQSYREQLHFADGRGPLAGRSTPRTPPPAPPKPATKPTPSPDGPNLTVVPPPGTRGGVNIAISKRTTLGVQARQARAAIAKVHRIPKDTRPVRIVTASTQAQHLGAYYPGRGEIELRSRGPAVQLTAAHEIGHYLDHRLIGRSEVIFESKLPTSHATQEWLAAVRASPSIARLQAILADATDDPVLAAHVKYLLTPAEMWARSYAQWIAVRSGDEAMLLGVEYWLERPDPWTSARQWSTPEFEPIATAIDAMFREKGLLK
ncbi:phage minor capsid protein [Streptomyces sp. NPDC058650]|uniref:phage minor capsid protein n=1 Tax=Streptomyces sp. NPDC058650 TaxID=3346575 RepID=UPI00364EE09F